MKISSLFILLILFITIILFIRNERSIECYYEELKQIKVYCINRVSRPDRLRKFYDTIKQNSFYKYLDIQIVNAVDKDNLISNTHNTSLPLGALGCYYSHIKVLLDFLSTNIDTKYCLIFEDDAVCEDTLLLLIQNYLQDQNEYDLLIIGDNYRRGSIECVEDPNLKMEICTKFNMIYGSHAYFVNKKAANILIARAFPITNHKDLYYSDPVIYKDLRIGLTNSSICKPREISDSNTN